MQACGQGCELFCEFFLSFGRLIGGGFEGGGRGEEGEGARGKAVGLRMMLGAVTALVSHLTTRLLMLGGCCGPGPLWVQFWWWWWWWWERLCCQVASEPWAAPAQLIHTWDCTGHY